MSKTDFSFQNKFTKLDKDIKNINKNDEINEKPNYDKEIKNFNKVNENDNLDEKIYNNKENDNANNNQNYSFNESNPNYLISREYLNYYLSLYYEKDFSIDEKEEPKNAGFFARLFGNHPKIYPILAELKSERNFIIFLKRNTLSNDNDMVDKIFGKILNFIDNTFYEANIEVDKIIKRKTPSHLIKESNDLLKEKMKSFYQTEIQTNRTKNFFEEYDVNSIPILMIMQFLSIIEIYPNFIESFINKCFPNEKEIILAFSFYLSNIAYDRLLSGRLNLFFDKNKLVLDIYEEFYIGLFGEAYELFDSNKCIDQEKFLKIQKEAENMPSSILWNAKKFKLKYPAMKIESSLSKYFNSKY